MAPTSFTTAVLTFTNLWAMNLVSLAVVATVVVLYILGVVDKVIAPSVATSLICSASSFMYLVLQCLNVTHTKHRNWHKSCLGSACVQAPRILIAFWIVATTIGLVIVLRQPLCRNNDIKVDAAAWQAGFGCWMFRVLVSLNAVMLIISFSLFCLLEINGRYVPIGLFHFEYARNTQERRRSLIAGIYGASAETLNYPISSMSIDEPHMTREKRESCNPRSLSPSPTYHTIDSSTTTLWHGNESTNSNRVHELSVSEPPIPFDLTLCGSLPSRRPTGLTSSSFTGSSDGSIFSSSQLHSRPITDIPDLPPTLQAKIQELRSLETSLENGTNQLECISIPQSNPTASPSHTHPALQNVPVNITTPQLSKSRFHSACALPLEASTRTHSMVDLLSSATSTVDLASDRSGIDSTAYRKHQPHPSNVSGTQILHHQRSIKHRISTTSLPEHPPPAWCPQNLKSAPLSSDPAIQRLTEMRARSSIATRSRSSDLGHGIGITVGGEGSLSGFEFGFTGISRATPAVDASTTKIMKREQQRSCSNPEVFVVRNDCEAHGCDQEDVNKVKQVLDATSNHHGTGLNHSTLGTIYELSNRGATALTSSDKLYPQIATTSILTTDADKENHISTSTPSSKPMNRGKIMSRGRGRSRSVTSIGSSGSAGPSYSSSKTRYEYSFMPPVAYTTSCGNGGHVNGKQHKTRSSGRPAVTTGLGIERIECGGGKMNGENDNDVSNNGLVRGGTKKKGVHNSGRPKKVVERGRYETVTR